MSKFTVRRLLSNFHREGLPDVVLLYLLLLWNLISPAMRMRSFQFGAKEGLFSLGGVLLTFSFLTSLLTHVVIGVALGYYLSLIHI